MIWFRDADTVRVSSNLTVSPVDLSCPFDNTISPGRYGVKSKCNSSDGVSPSGKVTRGSLSGPSTRFSIDDRILENGKRKFLYKKQSENNLLINKLFG